MNARMPPVASSELEVTLVAAFDRGVGRDVAEVVAHEDCKLDVTNGALDRIDIDNLADVFPQPSSDSEASDPDCSIDLTVVDGYGSVQSVAVKNGPVAVAIARGTHDLTVFGEGFTVSQPGAVALYGVKTLTPET